MRDARDTFLHFLADNLLDLKVNFIRLDATNLNASKLVTNAVNVKFFKDRLSVNFAKVTVSIDVVFEDELAGVDAVEKLRVLLQSSGYTQKFDYTDPTNPVPNGLVFWEPNNILFVNVATAQLYSHLSCTLVLTYN